MTTVDYDRPTVLYRFRDGEGRLLYVGITGQPTDRIGTHMRKAAWSAEATSIEIERFPNRRAALAAETMAIREEAPVHNVATSSGYPDLSPDEEPLPPLLPEHLVGTREIADRLRVKLETVYMWRQRGIMPEPRGFVSGVPWWSWREVERWARKTGRLKEEPK